MSKKETKVDSKDDQKGYAADTEAILLPPVISDRACCGCCPAYASMKDIENM